MSKVEEIAEIAADGVADSLHIVGEEALAAEKVVQNMNGLKVGFFALGLAAGAAAGGFAAFRIAYSRAETKYSQIAADEVETMREHYTQKLLALETTNGKADLDELVREKGYLRPADPETGQPPMAVTPPDAVVEAARDVAEVEAVEAAQEESEPNVETDPTRLTVDVEDDQPPEDNWDWHKERSRRSPMAPYVIHVDERQEYDSYDDVTFTYYEGDDVLCNERDDALGKDEREKLIGEANLDKFGHGSGDANIVYIRNDTLEMDFEVTRSPNSFAEEVHGFDPPEIRHSHRRRGRQFDDD